METNEDSYSFRKEDIKLLCDRPRNVNAIVHCTKHNASKWLIKRMLSYYCYTPCSPEDPSARLLSMYSMEEADREAEQWMDDGIMTLMSTEGILGPYIKKTDPTGDEEWMQNNGYQSYNECFDLIFDDKCTDNRCKDSSGIVLHVLLDGGYVHTTLYGQRLKKGGMIYVSDRKMPGDIDGQKLRSKVNELYPNSHFELIAERDTARDTQFVFLKTLSCAEKNVDNEFDRKDE